MGHVDWQRRYALMRTHTALHMLSAVVWRDYRRQVTGGDMRPLAGRLDFEFESLDIDIANAIEKALAGAPKESTHERMRFDLATNITVSALGRRPPQ